ncbi:MAG: glycosyltransferase [Anaerolinea sp.]|nr:glycosyltransferase [Anaerolinea sp.]
MRVLLLTPALPYPPHQGGALRNYGILRGLRDAGHQVSLFSFHDGGHSLDTTPLPSLCDHVITVTPPQRTPAKRLRDLIFSGHPDLARRLETQASRDQLAGLLSANRYDLIQFEGLEMAIYLPFVRQQQPNAKLVYDAHNAEYALQRVIARVETQNRSRLASALYSQIQARRIASFEKKIVAQADGVIAVSDEDAAALRPFRPDGKIHVLPNGIFVDEYVHPPQKRLALSDHALVFTGKMDYRPNVDAMLWFSENILPLIHESIADARLYIVGQKPHASLEPLRAREDIELTGWVAEIQPFLHAASLYVAPLRMGSGTRLKILEAMAAGCTVVATSIAIAGLRDEARQQITVADSERAFADAVIRLCSDPAQRARRGIEARAAVSQYYDWSALMPCLLDIYKDFGVG